ncbi:hypothetical protein [Commensalibacter papalotli (ex Botero et al. 2024)]|uniref:Glycosyltransferase RgtA/B/C/D-like domain-containing protein n=1 Tax=Commensalibacter papalotli (ex Botero et al. 2024) TaxID=2972766 RepID=A0ABM9HJB9_9PROT|nr:hypothetical protein [Commensalibacter papalotli (ex Botero et al. 2024)]CAI3925787.1 unnamed protein product [Commensalibacter papalotli (ex Botero et al. 2024)]CAI3926278.1 unnamed protein product [Commensalibacter papalotli (ex Botero et al. 2024)]
MSGNILDKRSNQTSLLLFVYILFLFIRAPDIFTQGRFWAEEGYIFYANAYNMSPLNALFVVFGGYINLGASGATLIARYLYIPLEFAPYFTIFVGLVVQITPIYLLLTARDEWLSPFYVRLLATLLLLFVPESSEISLQSLHLQFHLALACTIIAFLKTDIKNKRYFKLFLLFFAPLCGLLPVVLIPIFVAKSWLEKENLRNEQTIALVLGSSIQLSFYLFNLVHKIDIDNFAIVRQRHFSYNDFCSVLYVRDIIFPFLGHRYHVSIGIMANIFHKVEAHQISIKACLISSFFIIFISSIFIKYSKTRKGLLFFITAILMVCISIYGVVGGTIQLVNPYFTERYAFLSQALFALMLLYFSITLPRAGKIVANATIIWVLIVGSFNFFQLLPEAKDGAGHVWRQELEKWRNDPEYHPKIWSSGWYMVIPKQLSTHTAPKNN